MRLLIAVLLALPLGAADAPARLARQIELVSRITDGTVGIAAIHIESGKSLSVRGGESFPMASAVKVPIAVQAMSLVDDGKLSLRKMIDLAPHDLHPGSGRLTDLFFHPGVSLSVENLMELMIVISDNSAADLVLREAGGPAAVTAHMRTLGLRGIRVDRSIAILLSEWLGISNLPPEAEWTREMWERLENAVPDAEHMRARRRQWADRRDTSTPDDMAKLLVSVWKKGGVLKGMLERCQTGTARIKGMLPQGTTVAHKSGTLGGVVADVGIVTLPENAGHVALAVFVNANTGAQENAEKAVAEISRTVYDYFLFAESAN